MARSKVTDELRQTIIEKYQSGLTLAQVAQQVGTVSMSSVSNVVRMAGISRRKGWQRETDPEKERVRLERIRVSKIPPTWVPAAIEMAKQGKTARGIALALGVEADRVKRWAKKFLQVRVPTLEEEAGIIADYQSGLSKWNLNAKYDVPFQRIRNILIKHGVAERAPWNEWRWSRSKVDQWLLEHGIEDPIRRCMIARKFVGIARLLGTEQKYLKEVLELFMLGKARLGKKTYNETLAEAALRVVVSSHSLTCPLPSRSKMVLKYQNALLRLTGQSAFHCCLADRITHVAGKTFPEEAKKVEAEAGLLLDELESKDEYIGNSNPSSLAAALIYAAALRLGIPQTQKEIKVASGVSEVTLRTWISRLALLGIDLTSKLQIPQAT